MWETIGSLFEIKIIELSKENNYTYDLSDWLKNDEYVEAFNYITSYTTDYVNPIKSIDMSFELSENKIFKLVGNVEKYRMGADTDFFDVTYYGDFSFKRINSYTIECSATLKNPTNEFYYLWTPFFIDRLRTNPNSFSTFPVLHNYHAIIYNGDKILSEYFSKVKEYTFSGWFIENYIGSENSPYFRVVIEDISRNESIHLDGFLADTWIGEGVFSRMSVVSINNKDIIVDEYKDNNIVLNCLLIKRGN